MQHELLIYFC